MSYTSGGLIEASDYNTFVGNTTAGLNRIYSTGANDYGYGQTSISTVVSGNVVSATNWATLVNTLSTVGSHQGTTITSRTAPVTGDLIQILANVSTDITSLTNARGNAVASGSQYTAWTGTSSKTTNTGSGGASWIITFNHTISFPSANAARYFFNAGGRIKWETSKTSTGLPADAEWNDLANTLVGDIYITGGATTQTIAGTAYTGITKIGGTGTPSALNTTLGWFNLTAGAGAVDVYRQYADTAPYTGQYINLAISRSSDQLFLNTTWIDPGSSYNDEITGGTATSGITFGTAPATVVTYFPPSATYLSNTWGTPTIAAFLT
jgi:hypothetical protein